MTRVEKAEPRSKARPQKPHFAQAPARNSKAVEPEADQWQIDRLLWEAAAMRARRALLQIF